MTAHGGRKRSAATTRYNEDAFEVNPYVLMRGSKQETVLKLEERFNELFQYLNHHLYTLHHDVSNLVITDEGAIAKLREVNAKLLALNRRLTAEHVVDVPLSVMADSYKAGHYLMYPDAQVMSAYGEFREPMPGMKDNRFVFYGFRNIIKTYLEKQWTVEDVDAADAFYSKHNLLNTPYPFPKDLFLKFIDENNGFFPVRIEALPEGTVAHTHTPVFIITAEGEYSRLCTFLETVLTMVWYPTTVATLSRHTRHLIEKYFKESVDDAYMYLLDSRLHDFGFRACTCVEQSIIGGKAHLLSFGGSDTMTACYSAQFGDNGGEPVATSIPATEHSVMTSWPTEKAAMENFLLKYKDAPVVACVMDSYDYSNALKNVLPQVADMVPVGHTIVLRPDSGNPVAEVLRGLTEAEKVFGADKNLKGYKVLKRSAVIQGDGITYKTIDEILQAVLAAGYSAQNVAFGMGGGLLQKVNRDTMSFATKLSYIQEKGGEIREIMKMPKTDLSKFSLPGLLDVHKLEPEGEYSHFLQVVPREAPHNESDRRSQLIVVYDNGPVPGQDETFAAVRNRVNAQWEATNDLLTGYDAVSPELREKIGVVRQQNRAKLAAAQANPKHDPFNRDVRAQIEALKRNTREELGEAAAMTDASFSSPARCSTTRRHRS